MKKTFISILFVFMGCLGTFANDADLFKFDYNSVQAEFTELNQLAGMITSDNSVTYSDLLLSDAKLVTALNLVPGTGMPGEGAGEPVLGIPSFLWGCGLGVVGLVIVYIGTDEDKVETKKALWGCVTSTAVTAVVYIVYYVAVLNVVSTI